MCHEAGLSCVQPWSCNSDVLMSSSFTRNISSTSNTNMMSTSTNIGSASFNGESYADTHNIDDEDFLIDDLSEFSNDDIAAPIKQSGLGFSNSSLTRPYSGVCTGLPPSSGRDSAIIGKDDDQSCLPFPCQDETGYDWLSSFGGTDDGLIYGASNNIDADSFLLSNVDPFGGKYGGHIANLIGREGDIESRARKDMRVGKSSTAKNDDTPAGGDDGDDDGDGTVWDKIMSMPITLGGRAPRSKRTRSAGWSTASSTLCNSFSRDYSSPSNSLDSTSNLSHQIIPTPASAARSSCTFAMSQHDASHNLEHVPSNPNIAPFAAANPNMELSASSAKELIMCREMMDKESCKAFSSHEPSYSKEGDGGGELASHHGGHGGSLQLRRCTHCLSQKTPQWRAGPQGPKTLCNACGVRYKSGRLFDEYRPAKSPTFLSYKHSNSHKKVMEMRRRKTLQYQHQQYAHSAGPGPLPVPSPTSKKAWVDDHQLVNKLKLKLIRHEATGCDDLPQDSHFSDVTLISSQSNRAALLDSHARFLY